MRNFKMFDNSAHRPHTKIQSSEPDLMYVYSETILPCSTRITSDILGKKWNKTIFLDDHFQSNVFIFKSESNSYFSKKKKKKTKELLLEGCIFIPKWSILYLIPERSAWQDTNGKRLQWSEKKLQMLLLKIFLLWYLWPNPRWSHNYYLRCFMLFQSKYIFLYTWQFVPRFAKRIDAEWPDYKLVKDG